MQFKQRYSNLSMGGTGCNQEHSLVPLDIDA